MKTIAELLAERATIINESRAVIDLAETEKREMTAEENEQHKKMLDKSDELRQLATNMERQADQDRSIAEQAAAAAQATLDADRGIGDDVEKRAEIFKRYIMEGKPGLSSDERRALQVDSDTKGGFTVPQQMGTTLIKTKDDLVFVRQQATIIQVTTGDSLGNPSLDADPEDGTWTAEVGTVDEDTQMAFGSRELVPHQLAKRLKVSEKLLMTSALNISDLVAQRLAFKFAVTEEKHFLTGNGAQQPLGVFTASANGISTGRDVATDNTTTEITADGLINAKYNQKGQYWNGMRWLFHRDALKQIQKLKDGAGQYLWQPGLQAGQPDSLLGFPFDMSEFAPNTFTAGLYVGILADWTQYWIAELQTFTLRVLEELYAENGQIGYIAKEWIDGMPVEENGFTRVTLAP